MSFTSLVNFYSFLLLSIRSYSLFFFFSSRRRHTRYWRDWSSDVCSSDLYPEEFKAEAVQLARSSPEKSIRQLAYELGISDQTLRNWIQQAQIDRGEREGLITQEHEDLRRLRRENRILREEREILKKAAAFFAKRSEEHTSELQSRQYL